MKVYQAISKVSAKLAETGISKERQNTQGTGYKFRGIDDVLNALAPILAEFGLVMLPRYTSRTPIERISKNGGALFYVTVEGEFDLVCVEDGSKHTVRTFGEAMDSSDKATNKAMSAAYKYAAIQAFCIPTEGDNDADAHTPETWPPTMQAPIQRGEPVYGPTAWAGTAKGAAKPAPLTIPVPKKVTDEHALTPHELEDRAMRLGFRDYEAQKREVGGLWGAAKKAGITKDELKELLRSSYSKESTYELTRGEVADVRTFYGVTNDAAVTKSSTPSEPGAD